MNEKNFQCDLCPKILTTKSGKLEHQQLHRLFIDGVDTIKRSVREYKCLECDVSTRSTYRLSKHMIAEHNQDPTNKYSCNLCDYTASFIHKGIIKRHKDAVHKNDEALNCEHCNKEVKNTKSLKAESHMKQKNKT